MLNSRSPSCGIRDVKIYSGLNEETPLNMGVGFFAGAVLERFDGWAIEDEEALADPRIREQFLANLYAKLRARNM